MDLLAGIQLLFAGFLLLEGAMGQILNITVSYLRSCPQVHPVYGYTYMSGSVDIQDRKITDYAPRVDAYIGNLTKLYWTCSIRFTFWNCRPRPEPQRSGCICTAIRQGGRIHDIDIRMPVLADYRGYFATVVWLPQVNTQRLLQYTTSVMPDYEHPQVTLKINGQRMPITNDYCPRIHLTESANIKFCVDFLMDPVLTMSFDDGQVYRFEEPCGLKYFSFDEAFPSKKFVFTYQDACSRNKTITCPIVERMEIKVEPTMSCKNGYAAGQDVVHLTGSLHLLDAGPNDFRKEADVYLGTPEYPSESMQCTVLFDAGYCEQRQLVLGCWCERGNGKVFDVQIKLPVSMRMKNKILSVIWHSRNPKYDLQSFKTPILNVAAVPVAYVEINDEKFLMTRGNCPVLPVQKLMNLTFCVQNLENPELRMWFDRDHTYYYTSTCGRVIITLGKDFLMKPIWFSYSDSCKRDVNIMCPQNSLFHFGCVSINALKAGGYNFDRGTCAHIRPKTQWLRFRCAFGSNLPNGVSLVWPKSRKNVKNLQSAFQSSTCFRFSIIRLPLRLASFGKTAKSGMKPKRLCLGPRTAFHFGLNVIKSGLHKFNKET